MTQAASGNFRNILPQLRAMRLCGGVGIFIALVQPSHAGERIEVKLDQAMVMTIPASVKTMVLGNPSIADITVLKRGGKMVITGKSFGDTNVVALDADGNLVLESTIRVSSPGGKLTVQRGMDRESYACNPICEPTISLGDSSKYFTDASAMATSRTQFSKPSNTGN